MAAVYTQEPGGLLCHPQEGFLDDILGSGFIAQKVHHEPNQEPLVAAEENPKRIHIIGIYVGPDQILVGHFPGWSHRPGSRGIESELLLRGHCEGVGNTPQAQP